MKLPKIPFRWLPGSWGLKGKVFEEAEAAYYMDGYALERRLIDIRHPHDSTVREKAVLDLDLRHGNIDEYQHAIETARRSGATERDILDIRRRFHKISDYDYDGMIAMLDHPEPGVEQSMALLDVDAKHGKISDYEKDRRAVHLSHVEDGIEKSLALLDVEFKYHRLSKLDFEKQRANLVEEPWFHISGGIDLEHGLNGVFLAMDWNSYWVDYLRYNGYMGASDQDVVDNWMDDVWRAQASQADLRSEPMFVAGGTGNYRSGNVR